MTFSATSLVKAVIPAKSLPSTTIGGWNPGKVRERKGSKGTVRLESQNSRIPEFLPLTLNP
jgi:hypothetical protein